MSDSKLVSWATALSCYRGYGGAFVLKQIAQLGKGKEATLAKSKWVEKAPSQAKSKKKTVESTTKGTPKKKLLASVMQAAERVQV